MNRLINFMLVLGLVAAASGTALVGGFVAGHVSAGGELSLRSLTQGAPPADSATPDELADTFQPFWRAWDLVHSDYVDQPVDDVQLMQGAIRGMLESLGDPHTSYMTPAEYRIATEDQSGELEGIGAYVNMEGDYLKIISPFPGSPAEAAGILPGDLIVKVDGREVAGQGEMEVISQVRGPAGTSVHLTIQRDGHEAFLEFDIVRARIVIPSVESRMLDGQVGYVKVNDFGSKTTSELKSHLRQLLAQDPAGLVLDLRGNPGGFLTTAIEVVSQFIPEGTVMLERFGDGAEKIYSAQRGGLATEIPLVVLIDAGSASASEIVAGAIQDRGRGTILGETSYGKGSVQSWEPLDGGRSGAVRVTIAQWLTPDGRSLHGEGVEPDVAVERTEADREAERDPQLDEAVRLLLGGG